MALSIQTRLLAPLARETYVTLTTYRRDGTPVATAIHLAVAGDHAFFRTYDRAGKHRRLRRDPRVTVAPATMRGVPTGDAIAATARELTGPEAGIAARALAHKYPILHGWLIPAFHRLRGYRTVHYRLEPLPAQPVRIPTGAMRRAAPAAP